MTEYFPFSHLIESPTDSESYSSIAYYGDWKVAEQLAVEIIVPDSHADPSISEIYY